MDTDRQTRVTECEPDETARAEEDTGAPTNALPRSIVNRTVTLFAETKQGEEWTPAPGRIVAERYRLLRSIGHGGMGSVWLAEVVDSDTLVAIKWLRLDHVDDAELTARFRREMKAALALRHESIVQAVDIGRLPDGRDMLVMDFVEGPTLASLITDARRTSYRAALNVGRQLASALAAAHAQGYVHRDVKPSNVIVVDEAPLERARVKLVDLGICRDERTPVGLALTGAGIVLGTPSYTAPEQLRGEAASFLVDLYSLGVLLHRMIAGRTPFVGSTFGEVLTSIFDGDPPCLGDEAPDVFRPKRLDTLVERMLAIDPDDRPESAAEVARTLDELADPSRRRIRFAIACVAASLAGAILGFVAANA